jgi:hypothetical protein
MEGVAPGRDKRVLNLGLRSFLNLGLGMFLNFGLGRFLNLTRLLLAFSPGDLKYMKKRDWLGYT